MAIDDIADAIAAGHASRLRLALHKAWADEANAVMILRGGCQSYFWQPGLAGHAMKQGQTAHDAVRALRPPVHFKLQDRLQAQLGRWTPDQAIAVVGRLQDIELEVKLGGIDETIIDRAEPSWDLPSCAALIKTQFFKKRGHLIQRPTINRDFAALDSFIPVDRHRQAQL